MAEVRKSTNSRTNDKELEDILNIHRTLIKVVGIGGAGNNTINRIMDLGIEGVETIAVNTDAQDLLHTNAHSKLLIGKNITKGLGAASDPHVGEKAARENEKEIKSFLEGAHIVFVTCGLGGGTGTGAAPVVAEIAKNLQALTISIVTTPFSDEGVIREQNALMGLERIQQNSDTIMVVHNDKLLDLVPDLPINSAFKVADEVLVNAVKGITELVTNKGLINLDFADVASIMKEGDISVIGIGESEADDKVQDAVERALQNPLLNMDIRGAKNALINIEGDESMSIRDARNVMVAVAEKLAPNARIVWGAHINENLKGKIKILIIATGIKSIEGLSENMTEAEHLEIPAETPDIHEVQKIKKVASPLGRKKKKAAVDTSEKPVKNVFNQIFEDEIKGDLNILKESIKFLDGNKVDNKIFRNLKNACVGLLNTAQLYSNKEMEEFTIFIRDVFEQLLLKKMKYSSRFLPLFNKIPQIIEGMVAGIHIANEDAQQVIKELCLLIDQEGDDSSGKGSKQKTDKTSPGDAADKIQDEIKIDKKDLENRLKMELN